MAWLFHPKTSTKTCLQGHLRRAETNGTGKLDQSLDSSPQLSQIVACFYELRQEYFPQAGRTMEQGTSEVRELWGQVRLTINVKTAVPALPVLHGE
jgi:hypothetical protein